MSRTHFHRQLAAIYDAGNKQAVAMQQSASVAQLTYDERHLAEPVKLTDGAFFILGLMAQVQANLTDRHIDNGSTVHADEISKHLAQLAAQPTATTCKSLLSDYADLSIQFDQQFVALTSTDPEQFKLERHRRILGLLTFESAVALKAIPNPPAETPTLSQERQSASRKRHE
jgi:hypothetical protein